MKLTTFILIISLMQVEAATFGQTVTLKQNNVSIAKVFLEIRKQTGYDVLIEDTRFKSEKRINADFFNTPLKDVIDKVVAETNLVYTIENKMVIIKVKGTSFWDKIAEVIQRIDLTGRVTNAGGQPLAGVSVTNKSNRITVSANQNGEFMMKNVNPTDLIVFSYIGYQKQEMLASAFKGSIVLQISTDKLEEIQVVAYGRTSKKLNTNDLVSVRAEDIQRQPVSDVLLALQTNAPGLQISQNSGLPGQGTILRIRGDNSITGTKSPLFVVDGITLVENADPRVASYQTDPFASINPDDIESVSVLKDAGATAIYGSRGANGVILITTKKAQVGPVKINLNYYSGVNSYSRAQKYLTTAQYREMRTEAYKNDGLDPATAADLTGYGVGEDLNRETNWVKEIIGQPSKSNDLQLSMSGGNASTTFLLSGGYHRENPPYIGDYSFSRASFRANITHLSKDRRFRLAANSNYSLTDSYYSAQDQAGFLNMPPNLPNLVNEDGTFNFPPEIYDNPYANAAKTDRRSNHTLTSALQLSYDFLQGLQFRTDFGYSETRMNTGAIVPLNTLNQFFTTGYVTNGNFNTTGWNIEPQLEYQVNMLKGKMNFLVGGSYIGSRLDGRDISSSGFASDQQLSNPGLGSSQQISTSFSDYRYLAGFARVNYNYSDKYLVELSGQRDGSSRFGPNNQYANFAAVSAGWIFSNEALLNKLSWLSFGKLKGSYGITGNQPALDYRYLETYAVPRTGNANLIYANIPVYAPSRLYNPNYAWELTKKLNLSMDLGFFKDRIFTTLTWYRNRSGNNLVDYRLPSITGFSQIYSNLPAVVENKGWEFTFSSKNISSRSFNWTTNFNISLNENQLKTFPNFETSTYSNTYVLGKPITIYKVFKYLGVNPLTGVYTYADAKGNPVVNPSFTTDRTAIADLTPEYYGALSNTFSYKGIQLFFDVMFVKQTGQDLFNNSPAGNALNEPLKSLERWQKPGDISNIQRFTASSGSAASTAFNYLSSSERYYTDASYIRLKNVSLSYSFSSEMIRKVKLKNARVYLNAQNLYTLTRYKGNDPANTSNSSLPTLRTVVAGVQLGF